MTVSDEHEIRCKMKSIERKLVDEEAWLLRLIRSRLRDASKAEDVLQEVRVAVLRSTNRPVEPASWAPWLCRIALRQCAMVSRKAVRERGIIERLAHSNVEPSPPPVDPVDWLIAEEDDGLVRKAFAKLDDQSKQVLMLKYVERLTYEQIGKRLNVTRHAIEHQVVRARKALRLLLLDMGYVRDDR